jgi:altronate hydrolase
MCRSVRSARHDARRPDAGQRAHRLVEGVRRPERGQPGQQSVPGNRDGGITTIWEKSLGAVLKAGTSPLRSVVGYAEPVTVPGLTFMDTPGYDPVSATGMVAGGANLLAFTIGRGSLFGSRAAPCLKISTSTRLYQHMSGDIDVDAGPAMSHQEHVHHGVLLFDRLVDMASGELSKSERLGFGAEEIVPWRMGATL